MSNQEPSREETIVLLPPPSSPLGALRALRRALRQLYDHFFLFTALGLLLWLTMPTIILPGIVLAAMYRIARQAQTSPAPDMADLLPALRSGLPWGPLFFVVGLGGSLLILFNLAFYGNVENLALLQPLWLMVLVFWLSVFFYSYAVAVALEWRSVRRIAKIAFLFVAGRPMTTIIVWIGVPILTAVSALLPLLLFLLPGLLALWATALTYPYPPEPEEPEPDQ